MLYRYFGILLSVLLLYVSLNRVLYWLYCIYLKLRENAINILQSYVVISVKFIDFLMIKDKLLNILHTCFQHDIVFDNMYVIFFAIVSYKSLKWVQRTPNSFNITYVPVSVPYSKCVQVLYIVE